ncbi:MAG: Flp pilus assembly protein CpaB [Planctomycetaceae bacterium]|nr:Flp pilus assembly protein CpaB [Planctomycetaceae bacterium]
MKQKNLVLMGIAVACGLVAAILTANMGKPPTIEMVDVLAAKKDLTTGTAFTKDNVEDLTEVKPIPKTMIPAEAKIILKKEDLIGKRLSRATHQGEYFNVADVGIKTQILFEAGQDIMSLPMTAAKAASGFVGPGSRVDILASVIDGTQREVFTLLPDMHVLAVDAEQDLTKQQVFPEMRMVSFAVTQKQALLITLANQRNCNLELLLRHPDAPKREYNIDKTLTMLKTLGKDPGGVEMVSEAKKEKMVKVYIAKENIPANTEIDEELIKTKFDLVEKPEEHFKGACTDLSPFYGQFKVLTTGVAKDAYVLNAMIGAAPIKGVVGAPPADVDITKLPPKVEVTPEQALEVAPFPHLYIPPAPPAPRIRDVAIHTTKGTIVHRYQETGIGTEEWKLIAILSPTEAAAGTKPPAAKVTD